MEIVILVVVLAVVGGVWFLARVVLMARQPNKRDVRWAASVDGIRVLCSALPSRRRRRPKDPLRSLPTTPAWWSQGWQASAP